MLVSSPVKLISTGVSSLCPERTSGTIMSTRLHIKARSPVYPGSDTRRFPVPDNKVSWDTEWREYSPVKYTAPPVAANPAWADPDVG